MRYIYFLLIFLFLLSCEKKEQVQTLEPISYSFDVEALEQDGLASFFSWTEDRIPLVSAHRGGPYSGYPENAIETFERVLGYTPAIIECDIAMTKDSVLVMMHDNTLDRTTNGSGPVIEKSWEEIQSLRLKDLDGKLTEFKVPTLQQVLEWGYGQALFTLDVKRGVPFEMVVEAVEKANMENFAAIMTYNADAAALVHELNSDLMISVGIGNMAAYEAHKQKGILDDNMIAFVGVSEPSAEHFEFLHSKKISTILGVLGNLDRQAIAKGDSIYVGFVQRGADVLATDRPIEAARVISELWPTTSEKFKYIKK